MVHRSTFTTTHRAKAYLVSRIAEEAIFEQAPLSDAETKMLYYSVDEKTIADEVADQFDGDCTDYEHRIADLLRRRYKREKSKGEFGEAKSFFEAAALLATEDHYLNVMVQDAALGQSSSKSLLQAAMILGPLILIGLVIVFWDRW